MQRKLILALIFFLLPFTCFSAEMDEWNGLPLSVAKEINGLTYASIKQIDGLTVWHPSSLPCDGLVTNGCFHNWTADDPDDWTFTLTEDANTYVTESSGAARLVNDTTGSIAIRTDANVFESGKTYNISIDVTDVTTGRVRLFQGSTTGITGMTVLTTVATHRAVWTATANAQLYVYGHWDGNATDVTFDNIIINEITDYGSDTAVEGYWRMNATTGSETDRSGNGITLAEVSSAAGIPRTTTVPTGFSGYSRDFEAGDTEALGTDDANLEIIGNQDFTYFVRYKLESDLSGVMIGQYMSTGNERGTAIQVRASASDDALAGYVSSDGTTFSKAIGATSVNNTNWHTAAVVFDYDAGGSTITVYLDGVEDTNGTDNPKSHTGGIYDTDAWWGLGAMIATGGGSVLAPFDGLIYEAGVWTRTFSASEILEMDLWGIDGERGAND